MFIWKKESGSVYSKAGIAEGFKFYWRSHFLELFIPNSGPEIIIDTIIAAGGFNLIDTFLN